MLPLQHQRRHLRDEVAQPPPTLTRSTTTYQHKARVEPQPKPTPLSPQQGVARRGRTPEDLTTTSEGTIREPAKWLATDEAGWRKREGERWQGKWKVKREHEGEEREGQTEEAERQEQQEHETRQRTPTTTRSRSAPSPPLHPGSTTAQLGLTTEQANEVHERCTHAQETQRESQREEHERTAERGARNTHPPPLEHLMHDPSNDHDTRVASLDHHEEHGGDTASPRPKRDMIEPLGLDFSE
jgi:hypothetical protein